MKHLQFIVIAISVVITSCTLDKTDYEAELIALKQQSILNSKR